MKNFKLISPKSACLVLVAGILFAAQTTQGQWVSLPAIPGKASLASPAAPRLVVPTVIQSALLPSTQQVENRELWVGERDLFIHIIARESLTMVERTGLLNQIDFSSLKKWEPVLMRLALLALSQEKTARPYSSPVSGTLKLRQSA